MAKRNPSRRILFDDEDMYFLTLEEFLEKYPFKIGNKVMDGHGDTLIIKSMSWSEDCETMVYDFENSAGVLAMEDLLKYNAEFLVNKEKGEEADKMLDGFILDHLHKNHLKNVLSELLEHIKTTPKEDLEREFEEIESEGWLQIGPSVEEFIDFCNKINKKPKYPDNYDECVRIAKNIHGYDINIDAPAYRGLLESFVKLLICRDAYWKIAGEEMGLDRPWRPDWNSFKEIKYCLYTIGNKIKTGEFRDDNNVLAFPTEEMRAFRSS